MNTYSHNALVRIWLWFEPPSLLGRCLYEDVLLTVLIFRRELFLGLSN